MVKNIKNLKLKITSIIMLVLLLTLEFGPFAVKATAQQYQYYSPGAVSVGYDSYNGKNVWYSNCTLGGETAYCIDYTCPAPSGTMTFRDYMSDQGMSILMNGYPNLTPAQMGLDNAEEAYMATQMALWEVMNRTGESLKSGLIFRVENVTPKAGMEDFYRKTTAAAANLVARAEANPYTSVPTMTVDNANVHLDDMDGDALIGPYTVNVSGTDASTINSIRTYLVNAPASARIVDANGNEKSALNNGDTVYVRMSRNEDSTSFQIKFESDIDRKVGVIYTKAGETVQDYVRIDTEPVNIPLELTINWEKANTLGEIQLVKVDQDDQPIAGVVFRLYDEAGNALGESTTGSDGKISYYKVPAGNYTLEEVSAPEQYVIKTKTQNITVKAGEVTNVKFVNERITGRLVITKVDDANKPLKDVTFYIYDSEGHYLTEVVTDAEGKAIVDVNYGTYLFKEISAPEGYIMDETLYRFSVDSENRTFYTTITNERYKGRIAIQKKDEEGTPIAGVKFNILDADKNLVVTITTNENGQAGAKNLPLGTYYYQEVEAPADVIMDTNQYEFKLEEKDQIIIKQIVNQRAPGKLVITKVNDDDRAIPGVTFNILDADKNVVETVTTGENGIATTEKLEPGTYYYKEVSVPAEYVLDSQEYEFKIEADNKVVAVKVVNHYAKGSLEITKYDSDRNLLSGVEFDILDENKNVVDHITTDANGKATSKQLVLGTYYYKETKAPDNVVMDTEEHKFVLNENNQVVTKEVINEKVSENGSLEITKVTPNGTTLAGVEFDILDEDNNVVDHLVTDANGKATSKKLPLGTYYYKETAAPENVVIDTEAHPFVLVQNNQVVKKTIVNELKDKIKLIKVDENHEPLAGVEFDIFDSDKNKIDHIVTNEEGRAETDKYYEKGTYYIQETKAPEGIVVDNTMYEVELVEDGQNVVPELVNYYIKGQLRIYKMIEGTDKPLAGAEFEIMDAEGNVIGKIVSGEDGVCESQKLPYGTYYFKEVKAPNGYIRDDNTYQFNVRINNETIEAVVYNTKEELPKTGGLLSADLMIILAVAIVSISGYGVVRLLQAKKD